MCDLNYLIDLICEFNEFKYIVTDYYYYYSNIGMIMILIFQIWYCLATTIDTLKIYAANGSYNYISKSREDTIFTQQSLQLEVADLLL